MNYKYAKPDASGKVGEYAPSNLKTEYGLVVNPSAAQYAEAGYYPFADDKTPETPAGKIAVLGKWTLRDGAWHRTWTFEDAPTPVIMVSKAKVEAAVDRMGLTTAFTAWLNSKAAYIGAWMRGGDSVPYDPTDNASDLASLVTALGIPQEHIASLIEEVREA